MISDKPRMFRVMEWNSVYISYGGWIYVTNPLPEKEALIQVAIRHLTNDNLSYSIKEIDEYNPNQQNTKLC